MKISLDQEEIFYLSEVQKKVMQDDILSDIFEEDIKRRLEYILTHKYEHCFKKMKDEWEPKLKQRGLKSIPLDNEEFAELVFSQSDYKNRKQRESQ